MTSVYTARILAGANTNLAATGTVYATVRQATTTTSIPGGTTIAIGQGLSGTSYSCSQFFLQFDTSAVPSGQTTAMLYLNCTAAGISSGGDVLEVRECSATTNLIAGDSLAALPLLGSIALPTSITSLAIPLGITSMSRVSSCKLVIHSQRQRTASAPVTSDVGAIFNSTSTGTTALRPAMEFDGPWKFRGISSVVESVTGSATLTLTEPAGAASGDLIVAMISMRSTATAAGTISLPSGWTRVSEKYTNSTGTGSTAVSSGTMAWIIRGSSAPSYAFPYAAGNNVIQGQCIAYSATGYTPTIDVNGTAVNTSAGNINVSVTGLTTLTDDALLVVGMGGGQADNFTAFSAATSPAILSGTVATTVNPTDAWAKRFATTTASGADTSVALGDAVKLTAGATGNFTATASVAASHLIIAAAFKLGTATGAVSVSVTGAGLTATAGTAGGAGPTTFNPLDKKDSNVALSNGNLTVTGNGGANNWARSVRPRSGKRYVEFTITTVANTLVGISGGGAMTYPGDTADSFGMFSNGSGSIAGAFPFWGPAYTTGDVVGMAVDFTAKLVWYRKNGGAWNGTSGDPTAGTGGNDISTYTGTTHYVVASEDVGGVLIGNFGATAFQTAAPTGYLAWDGTPFVSPGVTSTALAISPGTVTVTAKQAISPGVTSTQLGITAGTVTVNVGTAVSTTVTSTALATTAGSVTVTTTGGGTVTGQNIHGSGSYTGTENHDGAAGGLTLGFVFCAFAPVTITGIRFWKVSIDTATSRTVAIYNSAGATMASGTSSGEPVGTEQWITIPLTTPLAMTGAGLSTSYCAAMYTAEEKYPATGGYYITGYYSTDGKAYALSDAEAQGNGFNGNGLFNYGSGLTPPGGTYNRGDYWIDVEYSYSTGGGTNVSANVTGDIVTTTAGTVSVTAKQFVSTNVTSTALGITAGTVTVNAKASTNVTGDIVTTTAGTVTVVAKASVNVTGDIVTTTAGTVTVSAKQFVSTTVTGQALATTAGTVTVTTKQAPSVNVIGDVVTASAGSVSVAAGGSISAVAPGGVATTSAGTVTVNAAIAVANVSVPVTGSIATTSAGTVSVTALSPVLVTVTGQSVTASAGSVSVTGKANVTVTGSVATTSAGSVNALMTTNAPVTGQAISASAGTVTVFGKANVTLLGEQLTISDGAVDAALSITVPVTGRTANTSVGSVVVAGDANVEVTDLQIKVRVGVPTFTFDYQLAITGVQATVRVGFAQSPNWGTVPDDKPENWSPLTAGTREEWTPVDHVKNDWTPVPTTTPQDWTEADHPKSDWTRI